MCSTSIVLYAEIYASFRVIHFHKRLRLFSSVMGLRMVGMIRRAFDTDFWAAIIKCTRLLGSSHPDLISSRLLKVFDPTVLVFLANAFPHINPLSTCILVFGNQCSLQHKSTKITNHNKITKKTLRGLRRRLLALQSYLEMNWLNWSGVCCI